MNVYGIFTRDKLALCEERGKGGTFGLISSEKTCILKLQECKAPFLRSKLLQYHVTFRMLNIFTSKVNIIFLVGTHNR